MENYLKLFSALSDRTRLKIFLLLTKSEMCVCELVNILGIEQSRVSHCLRILKESGIIDNRREGKWIIYYENKNISTNPIIQSIKTTIKLSNNDLTKICKCKQQNIREKCKTILQNRSKI